MHAASGKATRNRLSASLCCCLCRLKLPVLARFQCGLSKQRVQSSRRSRMVTVAGLQSEMAQEESSRIPLPKVGDCSVQEQTLIPVKQYWWQDIHVTEPAPLYHDTLQGVTQPRSKPEVAPATFGFVERAERWNSRACMVIAMVVLMFLHVLAVDFAHG